jgi:hypothetical protein
MWENSWSKRCRILGLEDRTWENYVKGRDLDVRKLMEQESITLSAISQTQKGKYHMFSLECGI